MDSFKNGNTGIYSITVFAQKPGLKSSEKKKIKLSELQDGCAPGGCCC
jgi:hypothetical protein